MMSRCRSNADLLQSPSMATPRFVFVNRITSKAQSPSLFLLLQQHLRLFQQLGRSAFALPEKKFNRYHF